MIIFLSHNYKDKFIVQPIANRLAEKYGKDSIFYDSWSIKPGDGIIEKMNEGLEKASFFFFFISNNSLSSEMVKLEWQNAIMMRTNKGILKFIPIRLDDSTIPAVLRQTLYIDLYSNGLEVAFHQMIEVIDGVDPQINDSTQFQNLFVTRQKVGSDGICERLTFGVRCYMEPTSAFLLSLLCPKEDVVISSGDSKSDGVFQTSNVTDHVTKNGDLSMFFVKVDRAITKDNPFIFDVHLKKRNLDTIVFGVSHMLGPKKYVNVPIISIDENTSL